MKETSQKIEKTSVIKSRPMKVSNVRACSAGITTVTETFQSKDDHSKPSLVPIAWEDANLLWESLLVDDDEGAREGGVLGKEKDYPIPLGSLVIFLL
ncbi:hypothetical protein L1049_007448 [Liquidambar formosana]|uniref:Uncharacterized protein n=1 Tax=Liquidambar formosana TaxID=63359 RepID=A0AAP0R2X9_LIQFO